jgi:hypothetical protein
MEALQQPTVFETLPASNKELLSHPVAQIRRLPVVELTSQSLSGRT